MIGICCIRTSVNITYYEIFHFYNFCHIYSFSHAYIRATRMSDMSHHTIIQQVDNLFHNLIFFSLNNKCELDSISTFLVLS